MNVVADKIIVGADNREGIFADGANINIKGDVEVTATGDNGKGLVAYLDSIIGVAGQSSGTYSTASLKVDGKATIERMSSVPKETAKLGRSLGWDNYSPYASNNGNILHPTKTYGHTGYTGTSIVIDPVNNISVILLTNRVHPEDKGGVVRLRALVANVVAGSIVR